MSTDHRGAVLSVVNSFFSTRQNKDISLRNFLEAIKDDAENPYTVLLLDGITDPHNLGAILRSADQFNTSLVVLPPSRSVTVNETVINLIQ